MPDEVPIEDIRHSLYRFNSVVEVVRLLVYYNNTPADKTAAADGATTPTQGATAQKSQLPSKLSKPAVPYDDEQVLLKETPPPPIRITLAALDEYNCILQNGLDFYGATFFPTEKELPATAARIATTRRGR